MSSGQAVFFQGARRAIACGVLALAVIAPARALASGPAPLPAPTHAPAAHPTSAPAAPTHTYVAPRHTYVAPRTYTPVHTGPTAAQIAAAKRAAAAKARKARLERQRRARLKALAHKRALARKRAAAARRHHLAVLAAQKADAEAQAAFEQGVHDSLGASVVAWPATDPALDSGEPATDAVMQQRIAFGVSGGLLLLVAAWAAARLVRRSRPSTVHP